MKMFDQSYCIRNDVLWSIKTTTEDKGEYIYIYPVDFGSENINININDINDIPKLMDENRKLSKETINSFLRSNISYNFYTDYISKSSIFNKISEDLTKNCLNIQSGANETIFLRLSKYDFFQQYLEKFDLFKIYNPNPAYGLINTVFEDESNIIIPGLEKMQDIFKYAMYILEYIIPIYDTQSYKGNLKWRYYTSFPTIFKNYDINRSLIANESSDIPIVEYDIKGKQHSNK